MTELDFLPGFPPALSQPALFGALLLIGLAAGEAVRRYAALPRIVGYALAGVLLGPQATNLLSADVLIASRLLVDLSIGLIVFELGFRLDFGWLKRNRWLLVTAIAESLFCFGAIYGALVYFGFRPLLAAAAAAIGTATSPAVVLMVANDLRYDPSRSSFGITVNHRRTFTGIPDDDFCRAIREDPVRPEQRQICCITRAHRRALLCERVETAQPRPLPYAPNTSAMLVSFTEPILQ